MLIPNQTFARPSTGTAGEIVQLEKKQTKFPVLHMEAFFFLNYK